MSSRCPSASIALLALLLARPASGHEPGAGYVDPSFGPFVAAAVEEAAERLGTRPCALLLTDYTDRWTGLTLAEGLALSGRTVSEHVRSLRFQGSRTLRPRGGRRVFALTVPATPVVTLCREDLLLVQGRHTFVTAVVIHEVLHTLGLRDDVPSSVAITEQVLRRCF